MEKHRIYQVVNELAIANPGITPQGKADLLRLQVAKILNGIEICQTGAVQQILLPKASMTRQTRWAKCSSTC